MALSWSNIRVIAAALALVALPAAAAEEGDVLVRPIFLLQPSNTQLAAIKKYGRDLIARAEAAHRPVHPLVAINQSTTLISLESVAICTRETGCPLLVFRNVANPPVLVTNSYQNVVLAYRGPKTVLILKTAGPDQECLLPPTGRARCTVVK